MANNKTSILITATDATRQAVDSAVSGLKKLESVSAQVGSAMSSIGLGAGLGSGALFAAAIQSAKEAEQASLRLDAVLNATGMSAGFAKKELDGMADAMSKTTQFDDESIRNAEAELLKFGNIQGETFKKALALSADVAAFMGEDIPEAAAKLGKSLVEPETAFGLLKRAGVSLTEQQKDQIKAFDELGDKAKAQEIILQALQKAFGGSAEKLNTGLTKSTRDAAKAWDEFAEALGKSSAVQVTTNSFLEFTTQSLTDLKNIVERGDWLDKLAGVGKFALGFRGFDVPDESDRTSSGKITTRGAPSPEQLGAANQRLKEIEDAEYLRRKKRAEEIKRLEKPEIFLGASGETVYERQNAAFVTKSKDTAKFIEDQIKAANELNKAMYQDGVKAAEEYQKRLDALVSDTPIVKTALLMDNIALLDQAMMDGKISAEVHGQAIDGLTGKMADLSDSGKKDFEELQRAIEGWGKASAEAIVDFAFTGKMSVGDMVNSILKDLARMAVYKNVTSPMVDAFSGGDFMKTLGSFFGGGRASGGPVNAGQFYVVGEQGPELLYAGTNGTVVPNSALGGSQSVRIEIENRGSQPIAASDARVSFDLRGMVVSIITDDVRRGGPIRTALGAV